MGKVFWNAPGEKEDLALLAIVRSDKFIVIDGISAVIVRQRPRESIIRFCGTSQLLDHNLLSLGIDLVDNVAITSPAL